MSRKKILFVSAGNRDDLQTDEEYKALRDLFPENHKHVRCVREFFVSYNDLFNLFEAHKEDDIEFLHFSGHSGAEGLLFKKNDADDSGIVTIEKFKEFVSWYPNLKVIFLNSCSSKYIGNQLKQIEHVKIVIETTETVYGGDAFLFAKFFYGFLNDKLDFKVAFEKTREVFINSNFGPNHDRGQPRDLSGVEEIDEDFSWRLVIPEHYEYRLVYPNIADKIRAYFEMNTSKEKQLIFAYADNPNVAENFENAFNKAEFDRYSNLYMLDDEDLETLALSTSMDIFSEDLKVIFLAHSEVVLFDNSKLKKVFDDEKMFDEFDNIKFSIAVKNGINLEKALDNTDYFKAQIKNYPEFYFNDFDELCEEAKFENFINEINVDFSVRKTHIMSFPCKPTKEETRHKAASEYVKIFFTTQKYEQLINFIINGIRPYLKYTTPIIISDTLSMEGKTLKEALKSAFINTYKDSTVNTSKFSTVLKEIMEKGHIIVFRTNIPDVEKLKIEFKSMLDEIDTLHSIWEILDPPQKPTLIFFLNTKYHEIKEKAEKADALVKTLSKPLHVTNDELIKWTETLRYHDAEFDEILDFLDGYDLTEFADQCPSKIIEFVCDHIKIGKHKILSLS